MADHFDGSFGSGEARPEASGDEASTAWDVIALPAAAGVVLAVAAWLNGWVAGLSCTPLAAGLGWVAYASFAGGNRSTARHLVGLGAITSLAALLLALGGGLAPWLAATLCLACIYVGVRHSISKISIAEQTGYSATAPGLQMSAAADLGLSAIWELVAAAATWRQLERVAADLEHALDRYEQKGWIADPGSAFPAPPPLERVTLSARRVAGQAVEQLRFDSEFEPFDPEIAPGYDRRASNRQASALLWRHAGAGMRPTVISLHGFGMGYAAVDVPWLRRRGWDLPAMHRQLGFDIVYFNLPLHGPRNLRALSGRGFFDDHPLVTTAAVAQAVWDLRRLIGWLRAEGAPALALHGISLGGTVAALCASLEDGIAAVVPTAPVVDLAHVVWDQLPAWGRDRAERAGLSQEQLAKAWSPLSPLAHQVRVARPGRLLVAGFADRLSPPRQIERLWRHWGEPAIYWYPGGHLFTRARNALQLRFGTHLSQQLRPAAADDADLPPLSRFRPGGGGGTG